MGKRDGVVSIAIDYKNELNQMIHDYESALTEMGSNDKLSKGMKAEFDNTIRELKVFKAEMEKAFSSLNLGGKVDSNSFKSFKDSVKKNFDNVNEQIQKLDLAVSTINSQMDILGNGFDISKTTKQFKDWEEYTNKVNDSIGNLIKTLGDQGISLMSFDNASINSAVEGIKLIDKTLRNINSKSNNEYDLKILDFSEEELQKEANSISATIESLKDRMDSLKKDMENPYVGGIQLTKIKAEYEALSLEMKNTYDKMEEILNSEKLKFPAPDFSATAIGLEEISEYEDDIEKFVERVKLAKKELQSIVNTAKQPSAKISDKLEANSGEIVLGATINTSSTELWKSLSPILDNLQNILNSNPVVAPVKLVVSPTAVSSEQFGDVGGVSKNYSKKYQKVLASTGENAVIDLEGVYKKTFTSIMDEAVVYAKETVEKIQNIFEDSPIDVKFNLSQEELDRIQNFVLSNKDGKAIDISGQVIKTKAEVKELEESFEKVKETLSSTDGKKISFDGFDKFTESINESLGQLTEFKDMLNTLRSMESILSKATGVSGTAELSTQWEAVSKLITNAIKLDGNFRKNANIGKIASEYNKYLSMGGNNDLSSIDKIAKLEDSKNIINTILAKVKELNSQKVDTESVDKADTELKSVSSTLDDVISRLDHLINLTRDIGNTFYKMFKEASISDVDKQWSSIESKFKSIADESGKINLSKQKKDIQELMEMYQKYANAGGMKTPFDLTDNTETIKKLNKVYEKMNSSADTSSVSNESKGFGTVEKTVDNLTTSINTKTEAIKTEANTMELAARAEVKSIQKIINALTPLVEKIRSIPELKIPKAENVDSSISDNTKESADTSSTIESQEKIQSELKETQNQAEITANSLKEIGDETNISSDSNPAIEQQNELQEELKETQKLAEQTANSVDSVISSDLVEQKKIYDGIIKNENGTIELTSDIGLNHEKLIQKISEENELIEAGNSAFRERISLLDKQGNVIKTFIGEKDNVASFVDRNSGTEKLLHTHPSSEEYGGNFSIADIYNFINEVIYNGVKQVELVWRDKVTTLDFSGMSNEALEKFADQYAVLKKTLMTHFNEIGEDGYFRNLNDLAKNAQYVNTIAQKFLSDLGGKLSSNNLIDIDDKELENILSLFKEIQGIYSQIGENTTPDEISKLEEKLLSIQRAYKESQNQMKDAFQRENGSENATKIKENLDEVVQSENKVAENFQEIRQETERATESAEEYYRILSQVGEYGVDRKVSAVYKRNDGQLESVNWRAKTDDNGNILYDKDGNIDYDSNMTVISKYEQLEKIIVKADNELRNLQKDLAETQNYDPNASTKNIEDKIADQKAYIQLLEQTVKIISQSDEYLMMEQQIIDARNKAAREYQLTMGAKQEKSDAKKTASEEQKRQKSIEQTNRLLNKQQIIIDGIENSYNKVLNTDLDKAVNSQSDLSELANKKAEIQTLLTKLNGQERNSSNEKEFLQLEQLIAEYKRLASYKLKANNPSQQELGGKDLKVSLENQVSQYNKLIVEAEKYGDLTAEITEELKAQRDLIAEQDKNGIYTARTKKTDGSEVTANDYYNARNNYRINKSILDSYKTSIKSENKTDTTSEQQQAKAIKEEWDNAVEAVKDYESAVSKLNNLKASDKGTGSKSSEIEVQEQKIQDMQSSFESAQATILSFFSTADKFNSLPVSSIEEVSNVIKLIQTAANGSAESVAKLEDALKNVEAANLAKLETNKTNLINKFQPYADSTKYTQEFVSRANSHIEEISKLDLSNPQDVIRLTAIENKLKEIINDSKLLENKLVKQESKLVDLLSQMKIYRAQNTNMSSSQKSTLNSMIDTAEELGKSGEVTAQKIEDIKVSFSGLKAEVEETGNTGKSFFSQIGDRLTDMNSKFIAQFLSWQDWIRYIQQGISVVRELDTAMTEVRKVSSATEAQYKSFQKTIASTAKEIASTNAELINSSADFLRLGYSLEQAENLAKNASLFVNVGDGVDIDEATEDMITAMKAFDIQAEDSIKIVDSYNQIGNLYALSASDIGEAMKRSASALEVGNNTFEESIGMITAMNEIIQDSETTGTSLKVLSLRLRGASAELESMNEDTDGLCDSTSKLREQIKALSGVDIMVDDNTFKSTAQQVKELGAVFEDLDDTSQAALLEIIAGKSRSNAVAALLKNYKQIDEVIADLDDAEGSALKENQAIVDSIEGRIQILSATAEEFWQTFIDKDVVKDAVSLASDLLSLLTKFIDKVGVLPTLLGTVGTALSIKNIGRSKMYDLV